MNAIVCPTSLNASGDADTASVRPAVPRFVLAEQTGGIWKPNPDVVEDLGKLLQGTKPKEFEMWVEEDE